MVAKLLTKTVAVVQARVVLYEAVVQMVLLYGGDSRVLTVSMLKVLWVFHHWVPRSIAGNTYCHTVDR